jgi:hypothetical protein
MCKGFAIITFINAFLLFIAAMGTKSQISFEFVIVTLYSGVALLVAGSIIKAYYLTEKNTRMTFIELEKLNINMVKLNNEMSALFNKQNRPKSESKE